MMNIQQSIHGVTKVRATMFLVWNSNSVTYQVETEGGTFQNTLFFGSTPQDHGKASEFFFALGGNERDIQRTAGEGY